MRHSFIAILAVMLMASCARSESLPHGGSNEEAVMAISADTGARMMAGTMQLADADTPDEDDMILTENTFAEGSLLYVSQMGTTKAPNFSDTQETGKTQRYIYEYEENPDASWDAEGTYNFYPQDKQKDPIYWDDIRSNGSVGNAFSLYAFHFPVDNEVRFNVETDQRILDNLKKSDILGAYHATSALFTRLRFRLYHLMVYLRVTLYVPVLEANADDDGYSGFEKDALRNAVVLNAATNFDVEWRANRSSDTDAPLITLDKNNAGTSMLFMYRHNPGEEPEETIDVKELYKDYYNDKNLELGDDGIDRVRVYNFSVLFPGQTFGNSDTNFLQFQLNTPGWEEGGNVKNFYFAASQLTTGNTNFNFTQGTLQHLSLYLPRHGNETILVGADILPWTDASTDMTVTDQSKETGSADSNND